ncbi:4-hydroxy-3-polyprenylbenzoate decarboxylase [Cohaesibacter sp. ES.047]|uniref:UbiD family decarboxylase n=1 Tax=Cohaesibacter sp. ES.047 TaxID=1798205 RepID=UPI000BB8221E|nr:UbiD family decarboxylase [Cohaesibacter sp. ES.047]SNY93665.1 4-hydroxy-3-polyprenylbenzoate decarboxylase [Cohaesibacter sp. ES.047]
MYHRSQPPFADLRSFLQFCEKQGCLKRIRQPVHMKLEATELQRQVMLKKGPALLLEEPILHDGTRSSIPVLLNLFGTIERVAWGLGCAPDQLLELGTFLAYLRQPQPPEKSEILSAIGPLLKAATSLRGKVQSSAPCQEVVTLGTDIDLNTLPIQGCWPDEPAPLVTWPIVITRPENNEQIRSYNWGVYRMQQAGRNQLIVRWLESRGGAAHFRSWKTCGKDMPVAIAIGSDPATILGAVIPIPETLSEAQFSGLFRGKPTQLVQAKTQPLLVPANAEIVIEGIVSASDTRPEGPYGDHTGYYNSVEPFPVMTVTAITHRRDPIYISTFTGRAPDEPSVIAEALNDVFLPLVRQSFPEVVDCWLPPEAASYRIAVLSIDKRYAGQARRVMMGMWSMLPQFNMTKLIITVDKHVNARNWADVMWAVATKTDPSRDLLTIENTPMDYLDFASVKEGLCGKLGIDATDKIGSETDRDWGRELKMEPQTIASVEKLMKDLNL